MFTQQQPLFIYALSPVHMGAGTALGLIDNPIAREVHTEHPVLVGSGLKGAIRHHLWGQQTEADRADKSNKLNRYFGPESQADKGYAGAVSISDAQLVLFPVRCAQQGFVYATSALALARALRLLAATSQAPSWDIPALKSGQCHTAGANNGQLLVDAFELAATQSESATAIATWLAEHALPQTPEYQFFRDKLQQSLVIMHDEEFNYFVKHATSVEPHVRINNRTGTAAEGGLFYTENLPPESLFISACMTSDERSGRDSVARAADISADILQGCEEFPRALTKHPVQIGGDATTGRGQVVITAPEATS